MYICVLHTVTKFSRIPPYVNLYLRVFQIKGEGTVCIKCNSMRKYFHKIKGLKINLRCKRKAFVNDLILRNSLKLVTCNAIE